MTDASFANLSHHYEKVFDGTHDFRNFNLVRLLSSNIRGERVLDLGCGSGYLMDTLTRSGKRVYGIEPNAELIGLAKKRNPNFEITHGTAEGTDLFKIPRADSVLAVDVLEHIQDEREVLMRIKQFLPDTGEIVVVVPAHPFLFGKRDIKYGHYRRYSRRQLVNVLTECGFHVEHIRYWNMLGFLPYLISEKILRKELETQFREAQNGFWKRMVQTALHGWFMFVENNINLGFGLSLVCVATKYELN